MHEGVDGRDGYNPCRASAVSCDFDLIDEGVIGAIVDDDAVVGL